MAARASSWHASRVIKWRPGGCFACHAHCTGSTTTAPFFCTALPGSPCHAHCTAPPALRGSTHVPAPPCRACLPVHFFCYLHTLVGTLGSGIPACTHLFYTQDPTSTAYTFLHTIAPLFTPSLPHCTASCGYIASGFFSGCCAVLDRACAPALSPHPRFSALFCALYAAITPVAQHTWFSRRCTPCAAA